MYKRSECPENRADYAGLRIKREPFKRVFSMLKDLHVLGIGKNARIKREHLNGVLL
jgi:hypothetical protein